MTLLVTALTLCLSPATSAKTESWSVTSPNGQVKMTVQLASKGTLTYRVEHGAEGHRAVVITDSPLGFRLQPENFARNLKLKSASELRIIEEAYTMPHGKRRECRNQAQHLTLAFRNENGLPLELDVRAYNDGAAFRYRLPGSGSTAHTMETEATGFGLPQDARLWMQPSDKATTYSPAYETYYENEIPVGTPAPLGSGWAFPVLFRTADAQHWGLITEANVGTNFCASRLSSTAPNGVYQVSQPDPAEGNGSGSSKPASTLPWEMPWRVVILGSSPAAIVESTLVNDVCPPSQLKDASWVRPGRVAWSWWSDPPSPKDGMKQRKFIDLAAEMGWEYYLVDANWTIMDNGNIHDLIRYAKSKNVSVLLWYNSGGPHNVVTEKPRDCLCYPEVRRFEFDLLRQWGVKGVKVDFFQSDKQDVMAQYHGILRDAADYQIMVNFHGCTLPRGWSRTWPHLVAMEAVRGAECYIFAPEFPEKAPGQNAITPFTRNVVGPMDYTPVTFSDNKYPHQTTWAHELALSVVFESGWLHFADKPEAYLSLPAAPKEFLKQVPTTWDETHVVAGYPGQGIVVARRKGTLWFLAGINGQKQPREETLQLGPWLGTGKYLFTRIGDGETPRSFATENLTLGAGDTFPVKYLPCGGFAGVLKPVQ